jgi:hypothetical protein
LHHFSRYDRVFSDDSSQHPQRRLEVGTGLSRAIAEAVLTPDPRIDEGSDCPGRGDFEYGVD